MNKNLLLRTIGLLAVLSLLATLAACGAPPATATAPAVTVEASPTVAAATPVPTPAPTPLPTTVEPSAEPSTALTVDEVAVVADTVDQPTHFEYFERIPPQAREARQALRRPSFADMAERTNAVLAPFGYRLEFKPATDTLPDRFDLYKDDEMVLRDIASVHAPQVSADGTDLAMVVDDMTGTSYLVRPAGGEPRDAAQGAFLDPVFAGNDLITVLDMGNMINFEVRRGDETLYKAGPFAISPAIPVKGLVGWDGHWALELEGEVIVDGESLNKQLGHDRIFAFHILHGQPFFLFADQGTVGVSYAGQVLPQQYNQVVHYQCCEASAFNVEATRDMVWFHGLRDGTWYYVEMGVY